MKNSRKLGPIPCIFCSLLIVCWLAGTSLSAQAQSESTDSSAAQKMATAEQTITKLLQEQASAWTSGDLPAFVSIYAENAKFLSSTGLTTGRQQVLERYQKRYPDQQAMGHLKLEILDFKGFQNEAGEVQGASVVARWTLSYPEGAAREDATGLTLLTFRRAHGTSSFEIIHDASM